MARATVSYPFVLSDSEDEYELIDPIVSDSEETGSSNNSSLMFGEYGLEDPGVSPTRKPQFRIDDLIDAESDDATPEEKQRREIIAMLFGFIAIGHFVPILQPVYYTICLLLLAIK